MLRRSENSIVTGTGQKILYGRQTPIKTGFMTSASAQGTGPELVWSEPLRRQAIAKNHGPRHNHGKAEELAYRHRAEDEANLRIRLPKKLAPRFCKDRSP